MELFTISSFTFRRIYLNDISNDDKGKLLELLGDYDTIKQMFDQTIAMVFKAIYVVSPNKIFELFRESFNQKAVSYHYLVEIDGKLVAIFSIADNELGLIVHPVWRNSYITTMLAPKVLNYLSQHIDGNFYFKTRPYNIPMNRLAASLDAKLEMTYEETINFNIFTKKMPTNRYVF